MSLKYPVLIVSFAILFFMLCSGNAHAEDKSMLNLITIQDGEIPDLGLPLDKANSVLWAQQYPGGSVNFGYGTSNPDNPDDHISFSLNYYTNSSIMVNELNIGRVDIENYRSGKIKVDRLIASSYDNNRYSYIYTGYDNYHLKEIIYGKTEFVEGPYLALIECILPPSYSDKQVEEMMAKVEAKARELLSKGKPRLKLVHYGAFSPEALSNKAKGGDIVATLTDDKGRPVSGKEVYFFLSGPTYVQPDKASSPGIKEDGSNMAIRMPLYDKGTGDTVSSVVLAESIEMPAQDWDYHKEATTDANGQVSFNYVANDYVNYILLDQLIRDNKGSVIYTLSAYVFDEPPYKAAAEGRKPALIASNFTEIEYGSMAVIAAVNNIVSLVNVRPADSLFDVNITEEKLPYPINPDDRIKLGPSSSVKIAWISGERLSVSDKWEKFKNANDITEFTISTQDMGWLDKIQRYSVSGLKIVHVVHLLATPAVIYYEGGLVALKHGIYFMIGTKVGEAALEPNTEVKKVTEPILMVPHSGILIDLGNNSSTISTLEGTAEVFNKDGTSVNVTTGHKMNISPSGTFSQVSTFSQGQLDTGEKQLLAFAQISAGSPTGSGTSGASFCPCVSGLAVVILATLVVYYRKR